MKIFNCSKYYVWEHRKEIFDEPKNVVISINDLGNSFTNFQPELPPFEPEYNDRALILHFSDSTPDSINQKDLFDVIHANQILDYAEKAFKEGKNLVVHCNMGVCRSSAVSLNLNDYINRILSDNEEDFSDNIINGFEKRPSPNPHVSSIMRTEIEKRIK